MNRFLSETIYCDMISPQIREWAKSISNLNPRNKAMHIRRFIAGMHYQLRPWNLKASEVLTLGSAMCGNKANLQVALLRACRIPAAYGFMNISKETFKGLCPDEFYEQNTPVTQHA